MRVGAPLPTLYSMGDNMEYKVRISSGYTLILNQFWGLELSNNARLLYIVGLSYRGFYNITSKLLMWRLNVSENTFYKALKELVFNGLVEVKYTKKKGCIKPLCYEFIESPEEWRYAKVNNEEMKIEIEHQYNNTSPIMDELSQLWSYHKH